jgi:catechol 2,3-dioxygenase-like lactoylglutathione lyase family enzyme
LARSIKFYQDVLGFRLAAVWNTGAYFTAAELWVCLSLDDQKAERPGPDYTHCAFSISQSNFMLFAERLRSHGIKEWKDNESEGDSVYFLDPDGHKLEAHVGTLSTRLAECRIRPYAGMEIFE